MKGKDLIIGEIQIALSRVLGDSAAAVMRQAGAAASRRLWPDLPSGKSPDEAGEIMARGIEELGSWGTFSLAGDDDGVMRISFRDCYFASLTEDSGKACGEQPICYFGFGLVEETFKRLTGIRAKVELVKRDDETGTCFEKATPR